MSKIPNVAKQVPLMFQAQVKGRCQLQRLVPKAPEQQIVRWVDEWVDKAYPNAPDFGDGVQTRLFTLSWRFVTNGGQDDGVIRPVIGAKGWAFYPGSSMKGVFRRACTPEQGDRYCGKFLSGGDFEPGILRFHGGYPTNDKWQENLVDIVHPQQDSQVKNNKSSSAFVQVSLYKPEIKFGISSTIPLEETEWKTIWLLWNKALSTGIGCRTCAGYGQPKKHTGDVLYQVRLKGEGAASKRLDNTGEFRPNMFRAALRGHALRIFGGLTDENTAEHLVEELFGGISNQEGKVGLIGMTFREINFEPDDFGKGSWAVPTYDVEGYLTWLLTQNISDIERNTLQKLVQALTRFAMLLGGFGKSWRRADHRLFYPEYYEGTAQKPLIGCHWQWAGRLDIRVRKLEKVGEFIDEVRSIAREWMQLKGFTPTETIAPWREAWHPQNVQVWGRLAANAVNSKAIHWLHGAYREAIAQAKITEGSIYRSSVTGQIGQIGRLWHRMYPIVQVTRNPQDPKKPIINKTQQYLEILTLFPDDSSDSNQFLEFLESEQKMFEKLWYK